MGRNKRRRSSTSSSSSSSSSTSGSSTDCAGRYKRDKKKSRKHAGTSDSMFAKSKKRPSRSISSNHAVRVDVYDRPSPSRPRNGQETAGTSYVTTHIRGSIESDADPVVPSNSSNIPVEGSTDVAELSTVEGQRIQQLEDLVNQLLQNESDKHYTKLTVNPNCIPEFNPSNENESCACWLDKIDQLAHINQWDEKVVIYHMQSRLAGLAKTWYNNLDDYRHSWDQWKQLLIQAFPDHQDFPTNLKNMIFRVKNPGETWTEYYFAKQQLLRQCQITGKNAVAMIIDGISDVTIQSGAKVGRYASPEDLYRGYLSTLENTRHRRPNPYTKPDFLRKTDKYRPEHIKNSHHKSDSNRKIRGKCYNCGEVGHMQSHCPKERLECTLCKKLGHSVEKCLRNKNNRPKSNEHKTLMCDTQVTIRESDAKLAGLSWVDSEVCLNGYGGGTSKVLGISKVNLKVDLFDSNVPVYVVPDHLQTMAILIGRSVLSNPEAITVVKNGSARLFSTKIADIPEVDELPTKITLRAKQKVEIPPHHIGFVTCSTSDKFDGDIFVDKRQSFQPLKEYVIPNCVTSTNDFLFHAKKRTKIRSINNVPHSTTKRTPSELLLGYHPRAMNDSFLSNVVANVDEEACRNVEETRNETGERIRSAQEKQKAYFDAKRIKVMSTA
nr:unnamed protein product [Callosobruchus analis]